MRVPHKSDDHNDNQVENIEVLPRHCAYMIVHHNERREAAGEQHLVMVEDYIYESVHMSGPGERERAVTPGECLRDGLLWARSLC